MALFGRQIVAKIDTLEVSGLDMRFVVEKDDQPEPNKAELVIYNLSKSHRERIEQKTEVSVEILVGYQSSNIDALIFQGTLREAYSVLSPPDWVTTLRSGDSDAAVQTKRINKSYQPGTPFQTLWDELVDALGIGEGNAKAQYRNNASLKDNISTLLHGGNLSGSVVRLLERMARSAGLQVSIQDEALQVLPINKALAGSRVVLGPSTGLIGSPERGAKGTLKLRSLLIPDIVPGRELQIKSDLIEGGYVVTKVRYKGDTSSNDWYADVECKELQ